MSKSLKNDANFTTLELKISNQTYALLKQVANQNNTTCNALLLDKIYEVIYEKTKNHIKNLDNIT